MSELRIAVLAPLVAPIRPPHLGGAQVLLAELAAELVRRRHAVTLLAAEGSAVEGVRTIPVQVDAGATPIAFSAGHEAADRAFYAGGEALLRAFGWLADHAGELDLVHAHPYDWPAYAFAELLPLPVVHTVHLPPVVPPVVELLRSLFAGRRRARYVAVSRGCAAAYPPPIAFDDVVLNGIAVEAVPFGPRGEGRLLYAARISPEKGLEDALEVAGRLGRPLDVAGNVYDRAYYERVLVPRLGDRRVRYHGALARPALFRLMARADALLMPVRWEEPFGLTAAEAMAAGCPVVAYARGGLPEVVADGETGFTVAPGDLDALTWAADAAAGLDRAACRAWAEARFTLRRMTDDYERLYARVIASAR